MKLILCLECRDVVGLRTEGWRTCYCGKSRGVYGDDGLHATISGPCLPVGFANPSLVAAVHNQPEEGLGRTFEAFIIPKKCDTIEVI